MALADAPQGRENMSDHSASPAHGRDFAPLPSQTFSYPSEPSAYPALPISLAPAEIGRKEVPLDELSVFHLRTASDIAEIQHLRAAIALPASALADPDFQAREKKETRWDSWAPLNIRVNSLEPSASFH
jgi:hypothetical protein